MANGFCPYLLQHIREVAKDATPSRKIQPNGFTNMLMTSMSPGVIKNDSYNGHFKTVQVKHKQRFNVVHTDTVASCDNVNQNPYFEDTVSVGQFRQLALNVTDETVAQYCEDASRTIALGQPATSVMEELYDTILSGADALLQAVDQDLLNLMVGNFGINRRTGVNTSSAINLPKDATKIPLEDGWNRVMTDFKRNGGSGRPIVVGAGLSLAWALNQGAIGGVNQAGIDSRLQAGAFDYYYDENVETIFGTNQIGVFERDAVQIVEYLRYQGFKGGQKPGASAFGVLPLPVERGAIDVMPVKFDFQLRYNDCPQTFYDAYYGTTLNLDKGWTIILSKQFGLYTLTSQEYRATDYLKGNRGSYRYTLANECDNC